MLKIVVDRQAEPLSPADRSGVPDALEGQNFGRAGSRVSEAAPGPAGRIFETAVADDCWPSDPDEVPEWRLAAEARAAEIGLRLPAYRTRAQFEEARAACEARLHAGLRKAKPRDVARAFAARVRGDENVTFSNAQLADAFAAFCVEAKMICSENFFRNELKRIPGCRKDVIVTTTPRRSREVLWVIAPLTVSHGNRTVSALAVGMANRVA